ALRDIGQTMRNAPYEILPVFAQQSVRENARTGRTPQQVLDDARRAVESAGWDRPWGADADHLKTPDDLKPFVQAGYTFYTVDPSAYVDNAADTDPLPVLREKAREQNWDEIAALYLSGGGPEVGTFEPEALLRALIKYGRAIQHTVNMYRRLCELAPDGFDFEVSVDETDAPTTPLEHYFIASELTRAGVRFTSLALRLIGRFEKGVDYIGDLAALDAELAQHAAVTAHFGTYKISLHSASDKLSVYPLIVKHWGPRFHIKTAGTSYLEALRTLAVTSPALFERIWALALERYEADRATYHVSADPKRVPAGLPLPALLDDFHARQILHVTFGSALAAFGPEIRAELLRNADVYFAHLREHFRRHLELLFP
ncbi:MAG: hypothetical protein D6793_04615, partial [Thermoflexia bacterium]